MMNLSRHAFFWLIIVVGVVMGASLILASTQLVRLSRDAAVARQDVMVAELSHRLDGRVESVPMLATEADGALLSLPADLVAAVIDQGGSILASSSSSGRWDGEPAPVRWLDNHGMIRTGHWAASAGGAMIAGTLLHDQQGNPIGALIMEDSGTVIPLLAHILMPAALWGLLLLIALLPACWFGARLAVNPLARDAGAATTMLTALHTHEASPGQATSGLFLPDPTPGFTVFGRTSQELLQQFHAAVEAASLSGDAGVDTPGTDMPVIRMPGDTNRATAVSGRQSMTFLTTRATRNLLMLAAGIALCVWGAMAIAIVHGEQGRLADMRRLYAEAIADVALRDLNGATVLSPDQAKVAVRAAEEMAGVSGVEILAPDGRIAAASPQQHVPVAKVVRVVRPLTSNRPNGWRVAVMVGDTTDRDLSAVLGGLLAGLTVGLWTGLELLLWITSKKLVAPLDTLEQLAAAGATGDYRLVPPPGGAGEIGELRMAMVRFIGFLTLRAREVDLLLRDACHDTYDPGVVARAEAWARRFKDRVRFAEEDPSHAEMLEDAGLRRWLWYLLAMFLGVQIPLLNGAATLALVLAGVLVGGRALAWLPRWLGRRAAIAVAGTSAALVVWLIPATNPALAAAVIALAAGSIIHSATAGQAEPTGSRGMARDVGTLAAAAAGIGSAVLLTLSAGSELARLVPTLLPLGILAIAGFAFAVRGTSLTQPARTVFPTVAEFIVSLRVASLAEALVGMVLPAAAFVTAVLMAALAQGMPVTCFTAAGIWAALIVAPRVGEVHWLSLIARLLPGPALLALTSGLPAVPEFLIASASGVLAGLLWHLATLAVHQVARRERAEMPEQAALLSAAVWRGIGLLLPVGAVVLGMAPVPAILTLGIASAVGAVTVVRRRDRAMAMT